MREEVRAMMVRMKEIWEEMARREMVPNGVDMEAVNVRVQAEIAVEAMWQIIKVME